MSLDTTIDPQAIALATLVKGAVNYELRNDPRFNVEEDAIANVYGFPNTLGMIKQLRLPALSLFRYSEAENEHSTLYQNDDVVIWYFDYIMSPASPDKMGLRWPCLRAVWRRLKECIKAGKHDQVYDGKDILNDAGFVYVQTNSIRVNYRYAPQGNQTYPYFSGQMELTHREIEEQQLTPFLSLAANYILDGLEDTEQPFVQDIIYTPDGLEAKEASDNPNDPDFSE